MEERNTWRQYMAAHFVSNKKTPYRHIRQFCCTQGHKEIKDALICADGFIRRAFNAGFLCSETTYYLWTPSGLTEFEVSASDYNNAFPEDVEEKVSSTNRLTLDHRITK